MNNALDDHISEQKLHLKVMTLVIFGGGIFDSIHVPKFAVAVQYVSTYIRCPHVFLSYV